MLYGTRTGFTTAARQAADKQVLQLPSPGTDKMARSQNRKIGQTTSRFVLTPINKIRASEQNPEHHEPPHDLSLVDSQITEDLLLVEELDSESDESSQEAPQKGLGPSKKVEPKSTESKDRSIVVGKMTSRSVSTPTAIKDTAIMARNYADSVHAFGNPDNYPDLTSGDDEELDMDMDEESMDDEIEEAFDDLTAFDDEDEEEGDEDEEELDEDELEAMSSDLEALGSALEAAEEATASDGEEMSEDDEDMDDDFNVEAGDDDELMVDESSDVSEDELTDLLGDPMAMANSGTTLSSEVSEDELTELLDDSELEAKVANCYDEIEAAESCAAEEDADYDAAEDDEESEEYDDESEDEVDLEDDEDSEDSDEEEEDGDEEDEEEEESGSAYSSDDDDAEMVDQVTDINLSEATELEEGDDVSVAHVTCSSGSRYWQLVCNGIPVATLRPGQLKGPLKAVANDRLDNPDFNTALVNTIRAAGTDAIHVASTMGFNGIRLPDIVMPSIDRAVEARVIEDQRLNMKGWKRDMKITAAAINRGFYPDTVNPLASRLTKTLASIGVGNAASIVKAALAEAFDPFIDQVLSKTVEFRSNPPEAQRAIAAAIGQMPMLSSDDDSGENADVMSYEGEQATDDLAAMMEESSSGRMMASSKHQQQSHVTAGVAMSVEEIRALFGPQAFG